MPAEIEHALHRVESESERMSVLVDELLLLAQLDAGRPLAHDPVDLTRLAIDATSDARVAASSHRWLLELPDEPVMVRGDEHRLHQVLANLMSNAAKHTPKDTVVTVALAAGEAPGTIELSVTDDGPGIPPELQPTLFERFVRGDSARSRGTGGAASTGLGLAIVDAVTTAHGGRVRLESKPGRTRFVITLPRLDDLRPRRAGPSSRRGRPRRGGGPRRPVPRPHRAAARPRRPARVHSRGRDQLQSRPSRGRHCGSMTSLQHLYGSDDPWAPGGLAALRAGTGR